MAELQRKSLTEQIHDQLAAGITAGDYPRGALLPSVTDLVGQYQVSRTTAHRALAWLVTDGVAELSPRGYVSRPGRVVAGPQQRITWTRFPASEQVTVLSADLASASGPYEYVRPLLGLEPVRMDGLTPVIRREQVHATATGPFMLSVEWFPAALATAVPGLLRPEPAAPGELITLIADAAGRRVTRGRQAREARQARDDGRERYHLGLQRGACVLAEVWMWFDTADCLAYGEYVLAEGQVTENEFLVA